MISFYPDHYYDADMSDFRSVPLSRQQQLRLAQLQRQAALEEEQKRRMRYERSLREELARREAMERREMMLEARRREAEKSRRKEMLRRQALEQGRREAKERRRMLEMKWRQQRKKELELERQLELERAKRDAEEENRERWLRDAEYGIVRGPDGRLYRIHANDRYEPNTMLGGASPKVRGLSERQTKQETPIQHSSRGNAEAYHMRTSEGSDSDSGSSDSTMKMENTAPIVDRSVTIKSPSAISSGKGRRS
mmetsp:Transcript_48166/g.89273  ORF Transcript_48166/g.89273 Transcript_48166/m.89273 type:complete len:252 (-) Transcript_48166:319-1074(-)